MGRPPAYIFIVRHGNRLDAADQLWHLSSPTPYDPPLTYGGWTQSRAIGQRIADILRETSPIEIPPSTPVSPDASIPGSPLVVPPPPGKKRRYKVVVHSSPFLRCVQTSVAVASGIASDARPLVSPRPLGPLPPLQPPSRNNSMLSLRSFAQQHAPTGLNKSVLRVDAFLGEWLSPGYFELITPPPSSFMMVASAKAELLRREDYSHFVLYHTNNTPHHVHSQSTGHLWEGSRSNTWSAQLGEDDDLPRSGSQAILAPALEGSDSRPSSSNLNGQGWMTAPNSAGLSRAGGGSSGGSGGGNGHGYIAPKPHFALSGKAPVPAGYVAHARDACLDIDYQWDSMRQPYSWGDGGEFGEEWASMHKRFRRGLQNLVDWYTTTNAPSELVTQTVHFTVTPGSKPGDTEFAIDDGDDDDVDDDCVEETVVVLVSHGAGCNAMIGAVTQQPVLMDVGLASLTVVARKPGKDDPPPILSPGSGSIERASNKRHKSSVSSVTDRSGGTPTVHTPNGIVPLNQYYEVKLLANTEHLRSNVSSPTSAGPWSGGGAMSSVFGGGTRGRHANSLSSALGNLGFGDNGPGYRSASAGGSFHGSGTSDLQIETAVRRASGAMKRPPPVTLGGGKDGGVTIGSGVTTFSSPTSSPLGRARTTSIGLWSPASTATDDTVAVAEEGEDVDDGMEIRLSFGAEDVSKKFARGNKTISNASASTASSRSSSLSVPKSNGSKKKSNLGSSVQMADLDDKGEKVDKADVPGKSDKDKNSLATATDKDNDSLSANSLYTIESASTSTISTAKGGDLRATTEHIDTPVSSFTTPTARTGGLWQAGSEDGRMRELTSPKRRWAMNEPSAQL